MKFDPFATAEIIRLIRFWQGHHLTRARLSVLTLWWLAFLFSTHIQKFWISSSVQLFEGTYLTVSPCARARCGTRRSLTKFCKRGDWRSPDSHYDTNPVGSGTPLIVEFVLRTFGTANWSSILSRHDFLAGKLSSVQDWVFLSPKCAERLVLWHLHTG